MTVYAYKNGYRLRKAGRFGFTVYDAQDFYLGYAEFGHEQEIDRIINLHENKPLIEALKEEWKNVSIDSNT